MRHPHTFVGEIEPADIVKLRGEINGTEQSLYGEVFNIKSTDDGIEVDLNTYTLPSDAFYTLLLDDQTSGADGVDMDIHRRGDSTGGVGRIRKMMVYEPKK